MTTVYTNIQSKIKSALAFMANSSYGSGLFDSNIIEQVNPIVLQSKGSENHRVIDKKADLYMAIKNSGANRRGNP